MAQVPGTPYEFGPATEADVKDLGRRVAEMRQAGKLSPQALRRLRKYFRVKNIYNSNGIEGNKLSLGETKIVIQQGLTITGKPLKDSLEARNLAHALDLFEELADKYGEPLSEKDLREVHSAILKGIDDQNAGVYRNCDVSISGSQFQPPAHFEVAAKMQEFGEWLRDVTVNATPGATGDPIALACAAHAWFVTIHPFIDGNGRTARILMGLILIRFGYPLAIVTKDDRQRYYDALEQTQASDLTPFIDLVAECIEESLKEYEDAVAEQIKAQQWTDRIADSISANDRKKLGYEYELWSGSVQLLKARFRDASDTLNDKMSGHGHVYFSDFGTIEFEKFAELRNGRTAKRTWSFRIDIRSADKAKRFLWFAGYPSPQMRSHLTSGMKTASMFVAFEAEPFRYVKCEDLDSAALPDIWEIAYDTKAEQFAIRTRSRRITQVTADDAVRRFFEDVAQRQFGAG